MKRKSLKLLVVLMAASVSTAALAAGDHGGKSNNRPVHQVGSMQGAGDGDMAGMMKMMMQMHSQMMGGMGDQNMMGAGLMGGGAMSMGAGHPGSAMFGGTEAFDTDQDGRVSGEELRAGLTERLLKFDEDNNGALSIAEFEALHSATIREMMVDRFQYFDSDGDGSVTESELHAPANKISMMERRKAANSAGSKMGDDMMGGQSGSMMNDN